MVSTRGRIFYWLLRAQAITAKRNATLEERRSALLGGARYLRMPHAVDVDRTRVGKMAAEWLLPEGVLDNPSILYLHGGAYTMGSCTTHRALASRVAIASQARVLLPEFRLAPEHAFPASLEDALVSYRWLLERGSADNIAVVGDSSGGGLAVAAMVKARDEGLPLPAAIVCLSPWTDLEMNGESILTRAQVDPICSLEESRFHSELYVGTSDPRAGLVSPVYANLSGLPSFLVQVGDREILLSDSISLAERAREDGVDIELQVWEGMWHVWQLFAWYVPEAQQAIDNIGGFVQEHVGSA